MTFVFVKVVFPSFCTMSYCTFWNEIVYNYPWLASVYCTILKPYVVDRLYVFGGRGRTRTDADILFLLKKK